MTAPIPRVGGRVLLVSPEGRLLLIHERIDGGREHWLTPGGGIESGEPAAVAAVREVHEETGLRIDLDPDVRPVLTTRRQWSWQGGDYDQIDHYFVCRVDQFEPAPASLTEMERQTLLGYHWWSEPELRASREAFVPPQVADVLAEIILGQPSSR